MATKIWRFVKENVAAIIAVATAILTVVYAALRLYMYVYWNGYFTRLNIDVSIMDLNFDESIFAVIFTAIIFVVILIFMGWVLQIINDIRKKTNEQQLKGIRKFINNIKGCCKGIILSLIILSIINVPLSFFLEALVGINATMSSLIELVIPLYIFEMLFLCVHMIITKQNEKKNETKEKDITIKIIATLAYVLIILVISFSSGSQAINRKSIVQLVEDDEYMISYCDGERYVLHKVEYENGEIIIYRNQQKIVGVEDCEYRIKKVEKVILIDE